MYYRRKSVILEAGDFGLVGWLVDRLAGWLVGLVDGKFVATRSGSMLQFLVPCTHPCPDYSTGNTPTYRETYLEAYRGFRGCSALESRIFRPASC
jgi:hypothetical protein